MTLIKKEKKQTPFEIINELLNKSRLREEKLVDALATVYLNLKGREKGDFQIGCAIRMITGLAEEQGGELLYKLMMYDYEPKTWEDPYTKKTPKKRAGKARQK